MGYCVCSVHVVVDLIISFFNHRNNLNCYGHEKALYLILGNGSLTTVMIERTFNKFQQTQKYTLRLLGA